jgi:hypothetical protein
VKKQLHVPISGWKNLGGTISSTNIASVAGNSIGLFLTNKVSSWLKNDLLGSHHTDPIKKNSLGKIVCGWVDISRQNMYRISISFSSLSDDEAYSKT